VKRSFRLIPALTLVAVLGIPAASAGACPGATETRPELTVAEARTAVVCSINERRRARGLPKLRANRRLEKAATRHSKAMDRSNFFSHISPSGATLVDRIGKTGYLSGSRSWGVGENLSWGTGGAGSPRKAVDSWMKSPAHRAAMLTRRYRHVGIGVALGSPVGAAEDRAAIYTADFGYR
jgi:uncharacterized protein YkwD